MRWDGVAEGVDEGLSKIGPVTGVISAEGLAILTRGRVDVSNDGIDSLCLREPTGVRVVFEFTQEILKRSETS
jgi:hypothetical protein